MSVTNWQGIADHAARCIDRTDLKQVRYVRVSPRMYQELGDVVFPVVEGKLSFCGKEVKLDASIRDIHIVRVD